MKKVELSEDLPVHSFSHENNGGKELRDRTCKSQIIGARSRDREIAAWIRDSFVRSFVCVTDVPPVIGDGQ